MEILICDDDQNFVKKMKYDIESYFGDHYSIHVTTALSNTINYDVVFMDVDLGIGNGIEIARKLKERLPNIVVIFVSSSNDLVFDTLDVGIFQFIRKSNYEYDFVKSMLDLKRYFDIINNYVVI